MRREIYEVYAKIVDANGNYNTLSSYPKVFDSKNYDNDCEKTKQRAYASYYGALSSLLSVDTRQCQFAMLIRGNDGLQLEMRCFGEIADLPDPEPEQEPDPEPGSDNENGAPDHEEETNNDSGE